jgi:hypothetical protein
VPADRRRHRARAACAVPRPLRVQVFEIVPQFLDFAFAAIATLTAVKGLTGLATDRRVKGLASRGFNGLAINFARSAAVEHPLGNGSSLSPAASLSRPSGDRLTSATLLPPIAVNACEADAVAGTGGTDGAT